MYEILFSRIGLYTQPPECAIIFISFHEMSASKNTGKGNPSETKIYPKKTPDVMKHLESFIFS